MRRIDLLTMALRALLGRKLRSGLTVLSIFLGAFSIVVMTSLADSGLGTLMKDVEDLGGARLMLLSPKQPERMKAKAALSPGHLTDEDLRVLRARLPHLAGWSYWAQGDDELDVQRKDGKMMSADMVATDGGFFGVFNMVPSAGRFYSDDDNLRHARACVIGSKLSEDLFDGGGVGERITVGPVHCQVVAVVKKNARMGMNFGFDWESFVAVPLELARESVPQMAAGAMVQMKTTASEHNDIVKRIANAILNASHHGVDDYELWDFSSILSKFTAAFMILKVVVALVAGIALIVGGVGVMNMMFVSVSERRREIGIRKALGASPSAIQQQFLIEAALLAGTGGVLGACCGVVVTLVANLGIHSVQPAWAGTISGVAVCAAVLSAFATGLVFGTIPARRAASLDAVIAIRS